MAARLVLLLIVMASMIAIVYEGDALPLPFYMFLVAAFGVTILYAVWLRSEKTAGESVPHQFAVDPLIVTGLIYFTGGTASQLYLLYPLVVLAAGIAVSGRHALHVTILSILVYSLLTVLFWTGVLVDPMTSGEITVSGPQVFQDLMFRILIIALTGGATVYFAGTVFKQEQLLARFNFVATSILDNVATPLLAVDTRDRVVSANPAACRLLGKDKHDLENQPFGLLFDGQSPPLDNEAAGGKAWRVRRGDGSTFQAFCATSRERLPINPSGGDAAGETGDIHLVTLFDLDQVPQDQSAWSSEIRHRAAATVASEIAHVVRNPLTAIMGAGELLNRSVDQMFTKSSQLSDKDWDAVKSMCSLIFEQSLELDDKVKQFLEVVSEGSTDLESVMRDASMWSSTVLSDRKESAHGKNSGC